MPIFLSEKMPFILNLKVFLSLFSEFTKGKIPDKKSKFRKHDFSL
jgi:hypothetical protein